MWDALVTLRPPYWEEAQAMGSLHIDVLSDSHS